MEKKNGHGKEYNKYGYIKFEGEYLNGERHGHGKENYKYEHAKFLGDYLYGKNGMEKDLIHSIIWYMN